MNIIVTGAAGQLGADVMAELNKRNIEHTGIDKMAQPSPYHTLDITDSEAVNAFFAEHKPRCVVHCAAYTAVDKAEDEAELCYKVNAEGTEILAKACKESGAEMIYISTDYVFDGKGETPYETDAVKGAISTYGKSKLAGEEAVLRHLANYYIVRISWVFGKNGNNFVKTMLRLAAQNVTGEPSPCHMSPCLNVVGDQVGSPTYTADLAVLLCDMVLSGKYGTYHATNEGYCSWADFASEIMKQSGTQCKINPITTEQYPTKAARPKNSRLSKISLDKAGFNRLPPWQDALHRFLQEVNEK